MKITITIIIAFFLKINLINGQQPYYNDVDLNLTGIPLKNALATKIISTHTNDLSYSQAREALKIIDLEPGQNNNVLLVYGFSNDLCPESSSSDINHRRRNKNDFGGGNTCQWNREHTYPKSRGTPNLDTFGPGADVHMLRASDVDRNSMRGSDKFATGSGNSGTVGSNWYPGDQWKGDMARIIMYMYLRYGNQCLPINVGVGTSVVDDVNMIDLFLQWNAEDPVSTYEENRNNYLELTSNQYGQGNRNPFIDNPYLATKIWGGPDAEDIWGIFLTTDDLILEKNIEIYPNPVKDILTINVNELTLKSIAIYSVLGKEVVSIDHSNKLNVSNLPVGMYFITVETERGKLTRKLFKK
ncbi:MAG: endonuclease [Flavobacteriaceae bacterium]|nr:endonuclease [Flavobacteriaceae bacterium]